MSLRTTQVLGVIGAVVVFVATAVTWYTHDISVAAQAPVLLVIAAAVGAVLLFVPSSAARTAGAAAGILGLAIAAHCVVRMSDFPDFGATGGVNGLVPLARGGVSVAAHASTTLGAGPFVGLLGGAMMAVGGLGLASEAPEVSAVSRPSGASTAGARS